jgi:hypothetical protein|tara:strand:- start:3057 stop:8228 length:5172 start_codon:yes stop_codon:yes gene_type:complete
MACTVYRNPVNQEIDKVVAENGKSSKLFNSMVKLGLDKEAALKKWAVTYTPTFQNWFQNGEVDSNGEPRIVNVNGDPVFVSEDKTLKHATENLGSFNNPRSSELLAEINEKFKLRTPEGRALNIPYGSYQVASRIEKEYPGVNATVARDVGGDIIHLNISASLNPESIYHQMENQVLQQANDKIDQAMRNFLQSIGVKVESVNEIRNKEGQLIDAVAKADMLRKVVQVINGKAGIDTLPEEAAHFFVELLAADNNPLFNSMMNNIEGYSIYDDVVNDPRYQEVYNGDETKLKKEAVGKLIAQQLVKNLQGNDSPAQMDRAKTWFERVIQAVRNFFMKATKDPYSRAAYIMLSEKANNYLSAEKNIGGIETGEYYEMDTNTVDDPRKSTLEKLDDTTKSYVIDQVSAEENGIKEKWIVEPGSDKLDRYVGKPGTKYEGVVIKGRVSDDVKKYFYNMKIAKRPETQEQEKRRLDTENIRKETGTAGHATMEDLIELYGNGKGSRAQILANSPFSEFQFKRLENGIKDIVAQTKAQQKRIDAETGTKGAALFKTEQLIIDSGAETGGTIDLLVLYSDGSAAIYDYKFVSPSIEAGYVKYMGGNYKIVNDPFAIKMDTYNIQMGAYKQTLLNEYGISKVRQSRIVPIHVRYKYDTQGGITGKITTVQMGAKFSEFLEQIPVAEEMTDFDKVNDTIIKLINRKKQVEQRLRNKSYQVGETFEKAKAAKERMERQLRKLQLNQDVAYVLSGLKRDLKDIEKKIQENEPFTKIGDPNPFYLSIDELVDLNNDLIFYTNLFRLDDYMTDLQKNDPKAYAKTVALQEDVGRTITNAQSMVETKIRDRVAEKANDRGVKGIKNYNPGIDYMTGAFVTLSKQNNPYLRNLWEIVDELNYGRKKVVKQAAGEIQALQDAILAQSSESNPIDAFNVLINEETGNFVSKFQTEYYEGKDRAIQKGDSKWMKANTDINQESYDKKFKEYRKNKEKFLKRKYGTNTKAITRELLAWDKQHDVVKYYNTASISLGGKYFLKANEKWLTEEYARIQANPALKEFYEYYQDKVRTIEEMFGMTLGPGFIANVHKELAEHQQDGTYKKGLDSVLENLQVREHDLSLGLRDENTGKLIRKIPKLYIRPIVDDNGNIDPSLKSKDLGKGLLLLFNAAVDYKMKSEVLPEVMAMEQLLKDNAVKETDTDAFGNVIPTLSGATRKLFETRGNADVFTGYIDQYFFGNTLDAKDFKIGKLSGLKTVLALKQYHSMMALGIKMPVAVGAFFAGQFGLYQQAAKGRFVTTPHLKTAQAALMNADPKMRALADHFMIYQRDDAGNRATKLSANYVTRHMTNDKWFSFLATADRGIDATIIHSLSQNFGLDPETNEVALLSKLPKGTKSILELMEVKENPQWEGVAGNVSNKGVDRYIVTIPGMSEKQERHFRNTTRRISDKVKGTMTDEDIALYNNTLLMRFMMHYKSWLPGIAMERFGKQRYDNILKTFDEGTWISTWNNLGISEAMGPAEALDKEVALLDYVGQLGKDVGNIGVDIMTFGYTNQFKMKEDLARAKFEQWAANNKDNPEFTDRLKDPEQREEMFKDYVEMKRANIRAHLMEMRLTLLFMLLLMVMGGDYDDDGKIDIRQSWAGRKLYAAVNRTYREVAVFTQPQEFLESGRATGIPLLTLGREVFKLSSNTVDEMRDDLLGEDSNRDKTNRFHYTFKMIPGLNAFSKTFETSAQYKNARY